MNKKEISCPNCGTPLSEEMKFCPSCGKAVNEHDSLPTVKDFFQEFINYEPAIWSTIRDLIAHPGSLTQKFLSGDHNKVTSPAKLFILISALAFFVGTISVIGDSGSQAVKDEPTAEVQLERPGLELEIQTSTGLRINNIEYYKEEIDSLGVVRFLESRNVDFNPIMYWVVKRTVLKYQENDYEEISINHERNASILLYLLIPIFALYIKLFRRKTSFTENITFTLYFFSAFYLILLVSKVITTIISKMFLLPWILAIFPYLWILIYLIIAVKKNYEFNWFSASLIGLLGGVLLLISIVFLLFLSSLLILPL